MNSKPDSDLTDSVAVVTGASRGIGREIAKQLAHRGARVKLAARDIDGLNETLANIEGDRERAAIFHTDITDQDQVIALEAETTDKLGETDVLVCNSGIAGPSAPVVDVDLEEWVETIQVNVTGTFLCLKAFLPGMITRGTGSIVVVGSMTGKRPLLNRSAYATSKMALVGLVRTVAQEVGQFGVRVNLVSPGPVVGPRIDWVIQRQADAKGISASEARAAWEEEIPLRRLVDAREVASAVSYLASDAASGITGADLNVSAGLVMY